tara:strand:- start:17877 stop:18254 length:378 start_codon:yes stop_codon:yes gene_type:complete
MVETTYQNSQPLNYNIQQRFHFIELIIQWEGRLTTNHLQQHFGISRSNASQLIQDYLALNPHSLIYNNSLKEYQASVRLTHKGIDNGTVLTIGYENYIALKTSQYVLPRILSCLSERWPSGICDG